MPVYKMERETDVMKDYFGSNIKYNRRHYNYGGGNMTNAKLGEQLRIARLIRKRTLQNVADALGLTKNTVSYYEKGKIPITVERLVQYCEYLGIDYIEVLKKVS